MEKNKLSKFNIVMCSCNNIDNAKLIAKNLLNNNLAACINIIPNIISIYKWNNKIIEDQEFLLIIKTDLYNYPDLEKNILKLHEYKCPEIINIPIQDGNKDYLKWIKENLYQPYNPN